MSESITQSALHVVSDVNTLIPWFARPGLMIIERAAFPPPSASRMGIMMQTLYIWISNIPRLIEECNHGFLA